MDDGWVRVHVHTRWSRSTRPSPSFTPQHDKPHAPQHLLPLLRLLPPRLQRRRLPLQRLHVRLEPVGEGGGGGGKWRLREGRERAGTCIIEEKPGDSLGDLSLERVERRALLREGLAGERPVALGCGGRGLVHHGQRLPQMICAAHAPEEVAGADLVRVHQAVVAEPLVHVLHAVRVGVG